MLHVTFALNFYWFTLYITVTKGALKTIQFWSLVAWFETSMMQAPGRKQQFLPDTISIIINIYISVSKLISQLIFIDIVDNNDSSTRKVLEFSHFLFFPKYFEAP